jgi:K+-transporting ATPase c subunit
VGVKVKEFPVNAHLRAHLLLPLLALVVCCGLYPLVLYAAGQVFFPTAASGSLVTEGDTVRGSRLIAQPFTDEAYFWPRPSAAGYNGAASGASNWGASNPKLRDRVARQLGTLVKYKAGSASAGPDQDHPRAPQQDIEAWAATRPEQASPDAPPAATAFDAWAGDPANAAKLADIEPVPADMVMASGSGLDPHITLRNALSVYQLDRVARSRTPPGGERARTRKDIEKLVKRRSFAALGGLVGEPLVNVLELNHELDASFPVPPGKAP